MSSALNEEPSAAPNEEPAALILTPGAVASDREPAVFGLTANERLRRSLLKAGVARIDRIEPGEAPPDVPGRSVVLRGDCFYDERLIVGLLAARDCVLTAALPGRGEVPVAACAEGSGLLLAVETLSDPAASGPESGDESALPQVGVLDIAPAYNAALRRNDPPFVHEAREEVLRQTENEIFSASYKGLTDLVTKWVFPVPARSVVRVLARYSIKPNSVTAWSYVLAVLVTWLFAEGWFATGLLLGWVTTFLDTVDGKLARCTITSSSIGHFCDKALDQVHPPIWWGAWAIGLPGGLEGNAVAFWVVVGGYLVGRALEGVFLAAFRMEFFLWRPFDGFFRTIIARRNPNLILLSLGVAVGSPTGGYTAVAVWTAVCIVIAASRNVQAIIARIGGAAIRPWFEVSEPVDRV